MANTKLFSSYGVFASVTAATSQAINLTIHFE